MPINQNMIKEKLIKLEKINYFFKLNESVLFASQLEMVQLRKEKKLLLKQLEELILIFNHAVINKPFYPKYLMLHNTINNNYKITDLL